MSDYMTLAEMAVEDEAYKAECYTELCARMERLCADVAAAFQEVEINGEVKLKLADRDAARRAWDLATSTF